MLNRALDITHVNAVDKFDDGDYLVSARHTDTIYKVRVPICTPRECECIG